MENKKIRKIWLIKDEDGCYLGSAGTEEELKNWEDSKRKVANINIEEHEVVHIRNWENRGEIVKSLRDGNSYLIKKSKS